MSIHALAIHPALPDSIAESAFERLLRELGFLGDEFDFYGTRCFRPGAHFFEHIVFRHSHSVIQLMPAEGELIESEPEDSRNFCRIELDFKLKSGFLCGCNVRDPLCPTCSHSIADWPEMLDRWFKENTDWLCPACGHTSPAWNVNWQNVAGVSRYWIKVDGIAEGEAVPSDDFLRTLAQTTSCEWRYFWYHL